MARATAANATPRLPAMFTIRTTFTHGGHARGLQRMLRIAFAVGSCPADSTSFVVSNFGLPAHQRR
jgi:hypothetical protein